MQTCQPDTTVDIVSELETYFSTFRKNIIGRQQCFESPFGTKEIIYADWTASGRAYLPIEECLQNEIMPFVANTHTETTITGTLMSNAYEEARMIIKNHVHAQAEDILIFCGSGMTSAVNKLQRILGIRIPERLREFVSKDKSLVASYLSIEEESRPVVFVTHMEHHSNQVSWLETIATVEILEPGKDGNVDVEGFRNLLDKYRHRKYKIAAITACSNVTGIQTPYHQIAKLIHEYEGLCFVDFAASAPYVTIDMHPDGEGAHLDAVYFSPHKFLGGPGSAGILIFNKNMYKNQVPDQPGGGTVHYTNPWKEHDYVSNIEQREDGGTPPFLQAIKAAMCVRLKEKMGIENMLRREEEILRFVFARFARMKNVQVLEANHTNRLGIIAFLVKGAHYNLIVKILNDRFGIQTRGGCSCAGTYGHLLLHVDRDQSHEILHSIRSGNLQYKPGWIRLSVHPVMTNAEIDFIMDAIELTAAHYQQWMADYCYNRTSNEYSFKGIASTDKERVGDWFNASIGC